MGDVPAIIRIHPADTVAVALVALPAGHVCRVDDSAVTTATAIDAGHKIALVAIDAGAPIIKYGQPIGHATEPIAPGQHVHTHNMATNLSGIIDYAYEPVDRPDVPKAIELTFDGYVRADGRVGIRNEIWVHPTVGCNKGLVESVAREASARLVGDAVDGEGCRAAHPGPA